MAAPTFQAAGTAVTSAGTTISPAWPTHVTGDLGVLVVETSGNSVAMSTPSGWSVLPGGIPATDVATTAGSTLYVFYRIATSSAETAPATGALTDHILAQIVTFRGVNVGVPVEAYAVSTKTTASTTVTLPSIVTNTTDTLVVFVASRPDLSASTTNFGVPVNAGLTGLAEVGEAGTASGNGGGFVVSYGTRAIPGTVTTSTMTSVASTTNVNATFALKSISNPNTRPLFMTSLIKDANLISYWKLDGDSTDIKSSYNGTDTGVTYSAGQFGLGAAMSAGTSFINLGTPANLNFERTNSFSISMWVKSNNTGLRHFFLDKEAPTSAKGYNLWQQTSDRIKFQCVSDVATSNWLEVESNMNVTLTGAWNHIVATYSGTSTPAGCAIYVNGSPQVLNTTLNTLSTSIAGNATLHFGNDATETVNLDGAIDDVAIFNRVLSAAEVAGIWNGTLNTSTYGALTMLGVGA